MGYYKKQSGQLVKLHESLRFLDSYEFVSQSSENVANTLKANGFSILKQFFSNILDHFFVKLTQKGFFSYSYLDSFQKFLEPLPRYGDSWKNSLTGTIDITPSDYQHALNNYREFGCRNLGDYQDIYLKTDVLLLADIFGKKIRNVCLKVYTLDPSQVYSAPNLRWESILVSTNGKLGLLQDVDMLLFLNAVFGAE